MKQLIGWALGVLFTVFSVSTAFQSKLLLADIPRGFPTEEVNHFFGDSGKDIFPNPNPSYLFSSYKKSTEVRGIRFVQLRSVEDMVANFIRYKDKHIALSLPLYSIAVRHWGSSKEGITFDWNDPRFGMYLFVCPIPEVAEDLFRGWYWNIPTNTGSYFHFLGIIKGLTPAINRLGMEIRIPTIVIYAIDDGYRFVAISQAKLSAQLTKGLRSEQARTTAQEKERDLQAAVMAISEIIEKVQVLHFIDGTGFTLHVPFDVWKRVYDRRIFFLTMVDKIKRLCVDYNLKPLVSVAVWDTKFGLLGGWNPKDGIYHLW